MTEGDFKDARNKAVLKVMEGDRKRFVELEKKYKLLQSEHNILKRTYLKEYWCRIVSITWIKLYRSRF